MRRIDVGPAIDYRSCMNLRHSYIDENGNQRVERLELVPPEVFRSWCELLSSQNERAAARLARILPGKDLVDSTTRWYVLCELLRAGATLDGICTTEAGNGAS